jgi:hypothetical protein
MRIEQGVGVLRGPWDVFIVHVSAFGQTASEAMARGNGAHWGPTGVFVLYER